jgi:histidine triad (HIT) family protein
MPSVFTRIIRREAPAEIVFETERVIAFLDHYPSSPGHTLVVPKVEVPNFEDVPPEDATALVLAVQRVARAVTQAMATPHYNLRVNNGRAAGQVVFHVHVHIMPRWPDRQFQKQPLDPAQGKLHAEQIRAALKLLPE